MERLEATSHGRVQMVMYRDFVMRHAKKYGLVGEVRNQKDGTVRTCVEGKREELEKLLLKLRTGPLLAQVKSVEHTFMPATHAFTTFTIRYDH